MTDLRVDWDDLRGSPRRIAGALHARRGVSADVAGRDWIDANWSSLAAALGADAEDALEEVQAGDMPDDVMTVTYRRLRAGVPMPENLVKVYVTTERHRLGAGVVLRLEAQWDTDVATASVPADDLGEDQAILLAEDALGVVLRPDDVDVDLRWRCFRGEGPACGPTWRVQWLRNEESVDLDDPTRGLEADTVYLDARSGDVVSTGREAADYTGHISQSTNYAGDTADVQRDMRYGEMRQFAIFGWAYSNTDSNGNYNWSTPLGDVAQIGLHSRGQTVMEPHHADPASCSPMLAYDWQTFSLSSGAEFTIAPNATTHRRGDWLLFHYLNYAVDMYWDFSNIAEFPSTVWFNAGPGSAGQFKPCSGSTGSGSLNVGNGNDTGHVGLRDVFWEEIHHGSDWCAQTVGPGCGYTNVNPRSPLGSAWGHAHGRAIGSYVNDYETWAAGQATSSHLRYQGIAVPGDLVLHDSEIEGTPTIGPTGCNPNVAGAYTCAADEACFRTTAIAAHDHPRCMKRASSLSQCQSMFPEQPYYLIGWQDVGSDPSNPNGGIDICVSNDYGNGRIWMHLGEQLMTSAGYFSGVGAIHAAQHGLTRTRQFTTTADNYHEVMAPWAGEYEASNAFHNISVESFPWLDDTTDRWGHSEVIRIPRNTTLTFSQGGPTGTGLAFNQGLDAPGAVYDADSFLIMVDQGETYEISATTGSTSVDLCIYAYNYMTSAFLGQSPGCTDGASTPATRNATLTISVGTANRVDFLVSNLLDQAGTYQLQIRNVNDDYPDQLSFNLTSQPLQSGAAVSGVLNSSSDTDLFHYYAPAGTSGNLTVTTTGAASSALVGLYQATAPGTPGGSPIAIGTGGASTTISPGSMYYVLVAGLGSTGSYTVTATHSGCGSCNPNGTFSAPLPLPSLNGGIVWNRLDHAATEPGYDTWAQCRDGNSCDWYAIDLLTDERLTITTFNVFNSLCDVEVSVFSDVDQNYWNNGSLRAPMTWDLFGAMESNGSQLTFVAPKAGTYRIRVRGVDPSGANCPRYNMAVTRGVVDMGPPALH